ncbi:threonine aldolase family protein [Ramlibacter sp. MMS24-I3-19]|uniref:threonine aldolase family protein n=1 Tax=Ramlibacter sp. MMS24-I3-19 TaxID=3416606 RepID=UPI003D08F98C
MAIRDRLLEVADEAGADEFSDVYGAGEVLEAFEAEVAQLLGKEAAVFMVSGTMAQQAALRVHCERRRSKAFACHPQSHLVVSENDAARRLHGLDATQVGDRNRLYSLDDLRGVRERFGALVMELPERSLGGAVRPWNEIQEIAAWTQERDVAMHLDGARLWETQPFYGIPLDQVTQPFETVYVSFYKVLGAIAGAALAGPKDIIDEARGWQWRHGGRLVSQYPLILSARQGLKRRLQKVPLYCERARQIAAVLSQLDGIEITPNPPPTNMMHVYVRGDRARFEQSATQLSLESGILLPVKWAATAAPGWSMFELSCGEGSLGLADDEIHQLFGRLLELGR